MRYCSRLLLVFLFFSFFLQDLVSQDQLKREMRGVWIATVANIDWPISRNSTSDEQREQMIKLLDDLAANNINTIVMQVRPTADALYHSSLEPWSHWMSGKQGSRPDPYYDPLSFIIEEAHKRFMDVHAWLNPYRVTNSEAISGLDPEHLLFKKKKLFVKYTNRYFFNPGLDETREHLNLVVKDIVERYDIDAIHLDDYFYPYPKAGIEFDDRKAFEDNPRGFLPDEKDDWRRNNVDMIIAELQQTIKGVKPWVEFGVSPFGVWRNKTVDCRGSDTQGGVQNYDDLYADILKWLARGDIDYVAPQLYWEIGREAADYQVLAKWWSENAYTRNLYPGLAVYKLCDTSRGTAWETGNELIRQLKENRKHTQIQGAMYFSAKGFLQNKCGLNDSLKNNYYKYPALLPINPSIEGCPAKQPTQLALVADKNNRFLMWDKIEQEGGEQISYYIVYAFKGKKVGDLNDPSNILLREKGNCVDLGRIAKEKKLKGYYTFVVSSFNRYKYESIPEQTVTIKL